MKTSTVKKLRFRSGLYLRILKLMGIFGAGFLAACTKYGIPEPEYGVPANEIRIFGTVKSADSLIRIPGLKIRIYGNYYDYPPEQATTNAQGEYSLLQYASKGDVLTMEIKDVDCTANVGHFKTQTIDIKISGRDENNKERRVDVLMEKK